MPTYDYECESCHHAFEAFQSITAPVLTECPECKKPALKRLIGGGAGLIFKGSGFYCTDYKSKGYKQDESVDRHKKAAKDVKESSGTGAASPAPSTPAPSTSPSPSSNTSTS
jgi:putative FmdB family regulatory protein